MRQGDLVVLEPAIGALADAPAEIVARARGRRVLNVGAAGGVEGYLPDNREIWLHARIAAAAAECLGIDIDRPAIAHAARHGVEIGEADCEVMDLGRRFDLIVMCDVIEHLNAPGAALRNLMERHLAPGGELLVTTPNATFLGLVADAARGRGAGVYWDHVACYLPEHLQAICDRHGWRLAEVRFFSFADRRSAATRAKSRVIAGVGALFPRFHNSFLATIRAR